MPTSGTTIVSFSRKQDQGFLKPYAITSIFSLFIFVKVLSYPDLKSKLIILPQGLSNLAEFPGLFKSPKHRTAVSLYFKIFPPK